MASRVPRPYHANVSPVIYLTVNRIEDELDDTLDS